MKGGEIDDVCRDGKSVQERQNGSHQGTSRSILKKQALA